MFLPWKVTVDQSEKEARDAEIIQNLMKLSINANQESGINTFLYKFAYEL